MAEYRLINRREFLLRSSVIGGGILAATSVPFNIFSKSKNKRIVILHTNDVHSRIEAFPMDGGKYQGKGGFSARATIIDKIRNEVGVENVLLFDAGDILQGTPYFNYFQGDVEFKLMSAMKYDATAIGNHDFDGSAENLARLAGIADFPLICSNYDVKNSALNKLVLPYKIFEKSDIKIGVYGLGIELKGLVPDKLCKGVIFSNPLESALKIEDKLRNEYRCELIICLSHLGYAYKNDKISDSILAQKTNFTDLIIGGHTHTFMQKPEIFSNKKNEPCHVFQTGWGGINLGRVDFEISAGKNRKLVAANSLSVC